MGFQCDINGQACLLHLSEHDADDRHYCRLRDLQRLLPGQTEYDSLGAILSDRIGYSDLFYAVVLCTAAA
ncbi:hypothetical protein D3C73_1656610 [compost metagenome]